MRKSTGGRGKDTDSSRAGAAVNPSDEHSELVELRKTVADQQQRIAALSAEMESLTERLARTLEDSSRDGAGEDATYRVLMRRITKAAATATPAGAAIAIVGRGHDELLILPQRTTLHFPQSADGTALGYYPGSSLSAIAQLEAIRAKGATHLLLPSYAAWWLERYPEFAQHLERRYRRVLADAELCTIYEIGDRAALQQSRWIEDLSSTIEAIEARLGGRRASILDLSTELDLAAKFAEHPVLTPDARSAQKLPYMDQSVDVVVVPSSGAGFKALRREAERVAREVVVEVTRDSGGVLSLRPGRRGKTSSIQWPSVSIIIPCHNGFGYTVSCLRSLAETLPLDFRGEVIVVDDASSDETATQLKALSPVNGRLRIVRNERNLGFLASANRGAAAARGEVLLFLNNDMVMLDGWLPPLLRTLREYPDAGAVGGMLIFPDGSLQEAGGVVFADGSAMKVGYRDHGADEAPYSHVRRVDYCSGCLLATPRKLFMKLGGFDDHFAPGYYEDLDYCMRVRRAGRAVYYQPRSAAIHFEGATAGTDLTGGMKRHQVLNQQKFRRRWSAVLKRRPVRPPALEKEVWLALAGADIVKGAVT